MPAATGMNGPPICASVSSQFHRRRRGLLRGCAAVDDEAGAGHEAGIVRGEKNDALFVAAVIVEDDMDDFAGRDLALDPLDPSRGGDWVQGEPWPLAFGPALSE